MSKKFLKQKARKLSPENVFRKLSKKFLKQIFF